MNEPPPEESIPIRIDTSDLDVLTQKLVDADAAVQHLQSEILTLVSALSGVKFNSFAGMQSSLEPSGGVTGLAGVDTKLDAAIAALSARITHLSTVAQTPQQPTPTPAPPASGVPPAPPGAPTPAPTQPAMGGPPQTPPQPAPASTGPLSAAPTGAAPAQQTQLNTLFIQWLQLQIAATQKQQAQPPPPGTPGGAPGVPTPSWMSGMSASQAYPGGNWNQTMANTALQAGILNSILPYATGGQAPAGTSGSQATQPPPPAPAPTGRSGGGGGGLSAMGAGWLASSLAIATAPNVEAGMVGAVTGQLAGALAKVALVAPPWATALMGIAAGVGAAGLGSNALAASAASREQMLLANVGGVATGVSETGAGVTGTGVLAARLGGAVGASPTPLPGMPQAPGQGSLLQQIYKAGVDYYVPPSQSVQTATQLGESGMRQQDIVSNLRNTLAFSAVTGESLQSSAALTSTLAMQGGQTPTQISKIFQDMWLSAEKAGIPMNKMVDSIQTLEQVTNGAARSVYDIAGAVAVQKIVGPNVNTGALFQSGQTAIGFDAIAQAGMLGVSPERFASIQGNQAAYFDTVSTRLQDLFGGGKPIANPSQGTIDLAAGVAQSELGVNLAQYSPIIASGMVRAFLDNKPAQAEALARQNVALAGPTSFTDQGKAVADATTSQATKDLVQAETLLAQNANSLAAAFNNLTTIITNPNATIPTPWGDVPAWALQGGLDSIPGVKGLENIFTAPARVTPGGLPGRNDTAGWDAYAAANPNANWQVWGDRTAQSNYVQALANLGIKPDSGMSLHVDSTLKNNQVTGGYTLGPDLARMYYQAAYKYGVNPLLLMGQGAQESGFQSTARSNAGAMGIAQFMQGTIDSLATKPGSPVVPGKGTILDSKGEVTGGPLYMRQGGAQFDPYNPQQEIALQAFYMQQLIAQAHGSVTAALNMYYGSAAAMPGSTLSYAQQVEEKAQHVAIEVNVAGKVTLNDITGQMIGLGTVTPQKHTINLERTPKGAPAKAIPPPKKKRL